MNENINKSVIKISVRNLVEFVLRSGDIDSSFFTSSRALEGTKIHQKIQKSFGSEYEAEVSLKHSEVYKGFEFIVEGRADGVITKDGEIIIDEIKSTTNSIEGIDENINQLHLSQAKCYAYFYACVNNLNSIYVQLTYCQLETSEIKRIKKKYDIEELTSSFLALLDKYFIWADLTKKLTTKRDKSISTLKFPFQEYRAGQRKFAMAVYGTIKQQKKLYAQAPTGIGKTISTLFPAVMAMGKGLTCKIFYLTARTLTRTVAEDALNKMCSNGLNIRSVTLTAKDKICFNKGAACNKEECEFAKGHFDRVNAAVLEILNEKTIINRDIITTTARKHKICPFEFSLDIALWADCIICDYNYVFDPRVYLKSFFDNQDSYTFLIDEAHNLVDRAREMFSATISKKTFLELKSEMKTLDIKVSGALSKINSFLLKTGKTITDEEDELQYSNKNVSNIIAQITEPEKIYPLIRKFIEVTEQWLAQNKKSEVYEKLLKLYFDCLSFIRISEFYDKRYVTYLEKTHDDVKLKLFCLDPSHLLREALKRGKAAVCFSATLTPILYFRDILGGGEEDFMLRLPSPFDKDKRCLMLAENISTKYKNRTASLMKIVELIYSMVLQKKGNYLVFFPSYAYMNLVYEKFTQKYYDINTIVQSKEMSENERDEFLQKFSPLVKEILVGFALLGGIFSEGIDLTGERLSGAIIVGVGLPMICEERDIIRNYFEKSSNCGYEYAYMYPGMNKVLQSCGRVIRSENDIGAVLLIDERFSQRNYQKLFPEDWFPYSKVKSKQEIESTLNIFWKRNSVKYL